MFTNAVKIDLTEFLLMLSKKLEEWKISESECFKAGIEHWLTLLHPGNLQGFLEKMNRNVNGMPENVLSCKGKGGLWNHKICGFGHSKKAQENDKRCDAPGKNIGTKLFRAPEMDANRPCDCHADLWSIGLMMCEAQLHVSR